RAERSLGPAEGRGDVRRARLRPAAHARRADARDVTAAVRDGERGAGRADGLRRRTGGGRRNRPLSGPYTPSFATKITKHTKGTKKIKTRIRFFRELRDLRVQKGCTRLEFNGRHGRTPPENSLDRRRRVAARGRAADPRGPRDRERRGGDDAWDEG